jgi:predicted ATPase/transcriptional regulator with XRE-family HTH domain
MPPSDSGNLGTLLRRFRHSAGLSQEELSEKSGISVRNISDMERGLRTSPRPETLRLLADGLGLASDQRTRLLESARPESFSDLQSLRADGPSDPPATWKNSLPVPLTPLVGRERVLGEISALLSGHGARFTTLTGPGGVGKTRLAIEVARQAAPSFADGIAFVALAAVTDPAFVAASIADVLGVPVSGGSLSKRLETFLAARQLLLVLDNFEQVIEAAPLVAELLAAAPRLSMLVTSRTRLRLSAEHSYRVPGLDIPDITDSLEQLETNESLRLFFVRAQAVDPEFARTAAHQQDLAEICRRLYGIPLAIELAASKVNVLPITAIAARRDGQLSLLTGGNRDLPARQRTMRDTIAWSYGLLAPDEQTLLRWLSPFVGGFTLEAAETTGSIAGLPPNQVLDLLSALVDSALVVPAHAPGGLPRFRMLETIREYGFEQLADAGELDDARLSHARLFLAFASDGAPAPSEHQNLTWVHRLATERDNLVAAFDHVCQPETADLCLRFAAAMGPFWDIAGPFEEGALRLQHAMALAPPEPARLKGKVCYWAALLAGWMRDHAAVALADDGIANAEALTERTALAEALHIRAWLDLMQEHWEEAAARFELELDLWSNFDNPFGEGRCLLYLGSSNYGMGDLPLARLRIERAAQCFRTTGYPEWLSSCYWYFGLFAVAEGSLSDAGVSYEQSLRFWLEDDIPSGEFKAMIGLADVAAAVGLHEHAARLLGAADQILETTDGALMSFDLPGYERATTASRTALGAALFAARHEEGRRLLPEELLTEAGSIVAATAAMS